MAAQPPSALTKVTTPVKFGVGFLLVLLVATGYYFLVHTEVSAKIDQANRQTNDLKTQLTQKEQARATYLADKDELAMRKQKQKELNKVLPTDTEAASFLSALQTVSNVSGTDLKAWSPMEEKVESFYAKVPMKLELGGKFHQLSKFMYEVGRQDRIINMEDIEISDPKMDGEEIVLKAKVLATTFHLVKPKAPGAPKGAQK